MADNVIEGTWPKYDIRRAFVEGAKWWEFAQYGATTMWNTDIAAAEEEADTRYQNIPRDVCQKCNRLLGIMKEALQSSIPYIMKHNAFMISAESWEKMSDEAYPEIKKELEQIKKEAQHHE